MGVRPLRGGEEYWFEQIKPNFLYARTELFAPPPAATEGVLHDLGVEHEEKRLKRVAKKKVTVAGGAASKKTETTGATSVAASWKGKS
ncbi:hypothetical protein HanOQP8_Chr07g0260441 [Helianthus annuus]|nr:hypothetical protein HanHA89_Chr07g0270901 [Helianthus annuus]KAJ0732192.1 hypothetical protein HanOQP8_Chr07g0260441 [Helianthus annuus]